MNTSQYLTQVQKDRICVFTFGPAEFIPKQSFKYSMNYISKLDPVPLLNIHVYYLALNGEKYNVKLLEPKTHSPLQEHYFLGLTYSSEIEELGKDFQKGNAYE